MTLVPQVPIIPFEVVIKVTSVIGHSQKFRETGQESQ